MHLENFNLLLVFEKRKKKRNKDKEEIRCEKKKVRYKISEFLAISLCRNN